MTAPAKLNFKLYQGSTFGEVLRWESSTKVYEPITGITKSAPLVVSTNAIDIPVGWRVKFTNIAGMTELNSSDTYHIVTDKTNSAITINTINSLGFKDYISGGVVEFNKPVDMADTSARMQLRAKIDDPIVIQELTTQNGYIILDDIAKTITLNIPATITAGYNFSSAVYSLEIVSSGGQVTPFANGTITLVKEVTR